MPAGRIALLLLCAAAAALLGCLGCARSASGDADGSAHYGYTGSRPAACAACED